MKFKKHMKNTTLKNSNTHWAMETEITIPLSLIKIGTVKLGDKELFSHPKIVP